MVFKLRQIIIWPKIVNWIQLVLFKKSYVKSYVFFSLSLTVIGLYFHKNFNTIQRADINGKKKIAFTSNGRTLNTQKNTVVRIFFSSLF